MPFIPLFAGLGAGAGEWFLLALLVYAAVAMMRRPRRHRRWQYFEAEPVPRLLPPQQPIHPGNDPRAIRRVLPGVSAMTSGRLPVAYQAKVDEIVRRVDGLLRYADRYPMGSEELYIVKQTAIDYLPTTLNAYLALPPGYGHAPVGPDQRPALHVLWDQLWLLETKLDEIEQGVHSRHADDLLANGRFLAQRMASPAPRLELQPERQAES